VGEARGEAFDLALRPLDHDLEVRDELFVDGVICRPKGVERSRARSIEDPEHCELFMSGLLDERTDPRDLGPLIAVGLDSSFN